MEVGVGADKGQTPSRGTQPPRCFVSPGTAAGRPGPPGRPAAPPAASASRCGSGPAATPRRATAAACAWGRTARKGGCRPGPRLRAHACRRGPSIASLPRPFPLSRLVPSFRRRRLSSTRAWRGQHLGVRARWAAGQFPRELGIRGPGAPRCSAPRTLSCCQSVGERWILLNSTRSVSKPTVLCRTSGHSGSRRERSHGVAFL